MSEQLKPQPDEDRQVAERDVLISLIDDLDEDETRGAIRALKGCARSKRIEQSGLGGMKARLEAERHAQVHDATVQGMKDGRKAAIADLSLKQLRKLRRISESDDDDEEGQAQRIIDVVVFAGVEGIEGQHPFAWTQYWIAYAGAAHQAYAECDIE